MTAFQDFIRELTRKIREKNDAYVAQRIFDVPEGKVLCVHEYGLASEEWGNNPLLYRMDSHVVYPEGCTDTGVLKTQYQRPIGQDMPRKYELKSPIAVEAMELTAQTVHNAALWTGGVQVEEINPEDSTKRFVALNIPTNRPEMPVVRVQEGDYIVKDPQGRFSKVTAEDFHLYLIPVEGNDG